MNGHNWPSPNLMAELLLCQMLQALQWRNLLFPYRAQLQQGLRKITHWCGPMEQFQRGASGFWAVATAKNHEWSIHRDGKRFCICEGWSINKIPGTPPFHNSFAPPLAVNKGPEGSWVFRMIGSYGAGVRVYTDRFFADLSRRFMGLYSALMWYLWHHNLFAINGTVRMFDETMPETLLRNNRACIPVRCIHDITLKRHNHAVKQRNCKHCLPSNIPTRNNQRFGPQR